MLEWQKDSDKKTLASRKMKAAWPSQRKRMQSERMRILRASQTPEEKSAIGRLGNRMQPREAKMLGGVNQPHEGKVLGGKNAGPRAGERLVAHPDWQSQGGKLGSKNQSRQSKILGGKIAGRKSVESGNLARARALAYRHGGPTWPEARFYGLVFGNPLTALGFTAQQPDAHGIYDGAWITKKIIAELDGGGHHAFRDRRVEDAQKDIARTLERNMVLREEDEDVLFLKALAILEEL